MRALSILFFLAITGGTLFFLRSGEKPVTAQETVQAAPAKSEEAPSESSAAPALPKPEAAPTGLSPDRRSLELVRNGRPEEAVALLKEHVAKNPTDDKALEELGRLLARKLKNPKEALEYLERAVAANPENTRALNEIMTLYLRQQQPDQAEAKLRSFLKDNPESAGIHESLGNLYAHEGRLAQAKTSLEKAAKLSREPEYPLMSLAEAYLHSGKAAEASKTYDRILSVFDERLAKTTDQDEIRAIEIEKGMTQLDLADSLIAQRQFEAAEKLLQEVRAKHAHAPVDALWQKLEMARQGS